MEFAAEDVAPIWRQRAQEGDDLPRLVQREQIDAALTEFVELHVRMDGSDVWACMLPPEQPDAKRCKMFQARGALSIAYMYDH